MSGQRIDDKGGWPGDADALMKSKNRVKEMSSAEGAGELRQYEDTAEAIKRVQEDGERKASGRPLKSGHRY